MAIYKITSLQDTDMNAVSKNMVHSLSLNGMWMYIIVRVRMHELPEKRKRNSPQGAFEGPLAGAKSPS